MNEYNLYYRVFDQSFHAQEQDRMIETKCENPHVVRIDNKGVDNFLLLRFDQEEQAFLPFFNRAHDATHVEMQKRALRGISEFCDYILLVEKNTRLYVILVEMKSGKADGAISQLDASELFMKYIQGCAMRVANFNDYPDVDERNIIIRRVVLKGGIKHRPKTQAGKESRFVWENNPVYWKESIFPIAKVCK